MLSSLFERLRGGVPPTMCAVLAMVGAWPVIADAQVTRVSVTASGGEANGRSHSSSISSDGRFVAFASAADNLVTGDTNGVDDIS